MKSIYSSIVLSGLVLSPAALSAQPAAGQKKGLQLLAQGVCSDKDLQQVFGVDPQIYKATALVSFKPSFNANNYFLPKDAQRSAGCYQMEGLLELTAPMQQFGMGLDIKLGISPDPKVPSIPCVGAVDGLGGSGSCFNGYACAVLWADPKAPVNATRIELAKPVTNSGKKIISCSEKGSDIDLSADKYSFNVSFCLSAIDEYFKKPGVAQNYEWPDDGLKFTMMVYFTNFRYNALASAGAPGTATQAQRARLGRGLVGCHKFVGTLYK